ncbi:GNAT family N-acetyltransferase [Lactiplantibacillus carotarum]|uniref:GNAT family N-acetyltransferase n=1 Tax=Lactiplantibacillus carotarum TaxID=2993456 RepID=UPI00298F0077|nr:GNAT family N-acetyltransferase [Lactiplantibacillus carotarum]
MTIIETARLRLRAWQPADLGPFIAMNQDTAVMRYFPTTGSPARTRAFYDVIQREFQDVGYGLYAVEVKATGDFIGFTGFHGIDFDVDFRNGVEIGWRLAQASWGHGYATEAAQACLAYGFETLGFQRVYSYTTVTNQPSRNVMRKLGMTVYEYFDNPELPVGHAQRPHVCCSINRS